MLDSVNVMFWERIHPKENLGVKKANSYPTRCDICGDSIKSKNKKRLSLYRKDNYDSDSIKCFNCGYKVDFSKGKKVDLGKGLPCKWL